MTSMRIWTCEIFKRRRYGLHVFGLTLSFDKPMYGGRIHLEWYYAKLIPGSTLWQHYVELPERLARHLSPR